MGDCMNHYCSECKCVITFSEKEYSLINFGCVLCKKCQKKPKYANSRTDPDNDFKMENYYDRVPPAEEESSKNSDDKLKNR